MANSTEFRRGSSKHDRSAEYNSSAYPFAGGVNAEEPAQVLAYLAKFNAGLADVQSGLLASGLRPGMAGYEDMAAGGTGYEVFNPGADAASYGLEKV